MTSPLRHSGRHRWSALLVIGVSVLGGTSWSAAAATATGQEPRDGQRPLTSPAVQGVERAAPRPIFREDFETGAGTSTSLITQYVGADGARYRADPAWASFSQCNGIVTNYTAQTGQTCRSDEGSVNGLAYALGLINGAAPRTNHVVSAWTWDRSVPPGAVQVGSLRNASIGGTDRFISFGVDAAASACVGFTHPLLRFSLVDGGNERPVTSSAIDPCSSPGSRPYTVDGQTVRGGRFVADAALLVTNDSVGWTMRNDQGSFSGNDGAIDGVTMYDATPKLENAFDGSTPIIGDTARLTFTVQNTTENGAKAGWSFEEALPDGLSLAADPRVVTNCSQADVTAVGGSSAIAVTGGLARGSATCEVAVDVTSSMVGTYSIDADTVVAHRGIDLPGPTSITFRAEENALVVEDRAVLGGSADEVADIGEDIAFAQVVTNAGERRVTDLVVEGLNGAVTCESRELDAGASTNCATAPRPVGQEDVDRGHIDDRVTASARSPLGADVRASASATQATTAAEPAIATSVTATLEESDRPEPDLPVFLTVSVTNVGNVTLREVSAVLPEHGDATVTCPEGELAPRATVECRVSQYRLTQEDIDRGGLTFPERASGTAPDGRTVDASDEATVAVRRAPALSTSITAHLAPSEHDVPVAGDAVEVEITVENTGNTTLSDVASVLRDRAELPVDCAVATLVPGETSTCSVPDSALSQEDIEAGVLEFAETASGTAPDDSVLTAEDSVTVGLSARSALFLEGEWTPSNDVVRAGDTIASSYTVTNTSNLIVQSLAVESEQAGAIVCRSRGLAPGEQTDCTAEESRHVVDADVRTGHIAFEAVAHGAVGRADGQSVPTGPTEVRSNEVRSEFVVAAAPAAPAALAFTGVASMTAGSIALGALGLGGVLLVTAQRQRRRSSH